MLDAASDRPVVVLSGLAGLVVALGLLVAVPHALPAARPASRTESSTAARDPQLTTYPNGITVRRQSNVNTKLARLPVAYRQAVRAWLENAYQDAGADRACANTPLLTVQAYHRSGFATSDQSRFPTTGEPDSCARGGYASIWSKRGGPWREVISGQEAPSCRALVYHRVPRSVVEGCYDADGDYVGY